MTKPLTCSKCGHRNSEHKLIYLDYSDDNLQLGEDALACQICDCKNFNTSKDNLRGVKK